MSIATEISRLQTAKSDLKTSIENKGVTVPSSTTLDGYAALVDQISGGGGSGFEDITADFNFVIGINTVSPTSFSALFNSTEHKLVMSGLFESINDFVTVSYVGDNEDVLSALSISSTAMFGFDSDAESGFTEYFSADGSATFYSGSMTYFGYMYIY